MDIKIPEQIKNFNFVLIGEDKKAPIEKGWQNKIHRIDDVIFQRHIQSGKNYGVQSNNSFIQIEGKNYFLIIIDFDKKEFQDKIISQFPETFTTTSGSPKKCSHLWFASDNNKAFKVKDENLNTLADLIGAGNQLIAPGSRHSSGSTYSVVKNVPIAFIPYAEIEAILKPLDRSPKKVEKPQKPYAPKGTSKDVGEKILNYFSMKQVLNEAGVDNSKNPTGCPFHSSAGGKCLGWNDETAHCFHCDKSWNKFSLIREVKNLGSKETFEWFADKAGMLEELKSSRKEFSEKQNVSFGDGLNLLLNKREIAKKFIKIQPVYYERKNQFWVWDFETYCWIQKDETDILNLISKNSKGINTIVSKEKTELLEALKQVGRQKKPEEIKPTWVQFKNKIYDIETGEEFEASPKYFIANPLPWKVGESEDTPNIDKLINSWVGTEDKIKLEEIISFVIVPKYFIHSFFFLYAPPGTGKSTFVNLLIKFIGKHNCTSTSIDRINHNARFETHSWHKKLLITLSEVSNINDLKNSGLINQATGEDPIKSEIKGGDSFDFINYGKFIYPTNKLLKIDKDDGFGRRVRLTKFTNRFEKEKDVLEEIPDIEFENLARKCIRIAGELWKRRQFTGDVTISERMKNYQEISKTPLETFIDKYCDLTGEDVKLKFDNFYAKFGKINGEVESKVSISRQLRKMGFEVKLINWQEKNKNSLNEEKEWVSGVCILGIDWRKEGDL